MNRFFHDIRGKKNFFLVFKPAKPIADLKMYYNLKIYICARLNRKNVFKIASPNGFINWTYPVFAPSPSILNTYK